ncbi:hypothetical protein D3C86_1418580 [compost metagenome]
MPLIDDVVVLQTWVCAAPCSVANLIPQAAGGNRLQDFAGSAGSQIPFIVYEFIFYLLHESIREANRVIRVLARYSCVCAVFPVCIEGTVITGVDKGEGLVFFDGFPHNELLDVRVVCREANHLRCTTGYTAGANGPCGAVDGAKECQEAGAYAAAGYRLIFSADFIEVGTRTGAKLKQLAFTNDKVPDTVFLEHVIVHGLNKASMRLRILEGEACVFRYNIAVDIPCIKRVHAEITGSFLFNAICKVHTGIKPLRAVRRCLLLDEHM